jgi:hypothetical protein
LPGPYFFSLSESDYARGYVGVCVNGNSQHGRGSRVAMSLKSSAAVVGGVYLPLGENARLALRSLGALTISLAVAIPKVLNRAVIRLTRN